MKWQTLNKATPFKGYFQVDKYKIEFDRFAGGTYTVEREVFERGSAAAVLPYDPENDLVLLIEQFRAGAMASENPWLIEPIAGIIDEAEEPEDVARREALEEAGCEVTKLLPIADYFVTPGASSEYLHCYCAPTSLSVSDNQSIHGLAIEGEDILVHVISREESYKWLQEGKIRNAAAVVCIQWLMLNYKNIKK